MRRIVIAVTLLVAASFAQLDTLLTQNFNAFWRTNNPPTGWRIFHTGGAPMGNGDWDRQTARAPWTTHPTPFAGIYPETPMDNTPDSLISPIIDCRGYMNVTVLCSTSFTHAVSNPYTAQIRYSVDSGRTFPYVARDYYGLTTGTIRDSLVLPQAMDAPGLRIAWVFYGDLWNISHWYTDDFVVTGEQHPYTVLFYEDFDTTWSTNNPPTGWRIYHTAPGDSGRDDWHREGAGAYPWENHPSPFPAIAPSLDPDATPDSMISPAINCAGFRNITLICSTLFYYFSDLPYVAKLLYSTDNGATWPYVLHDYQLHHDDGPIWEYLRLDSAKGKSQVRLAWVYNGDINYINWWSFDDLMVIGDSSPAYDVACESIAHPGYQVLPGPFQPSAVFRNLGDSALVNIPVVCSLYRTPNVPLYRWTATIPSLAPGASSQVTFAPAYNLPLGTYRIKFYGNLASDGERSNDTLIRLFEATMRQNLGYDDGTPAELRAWPVGHNGWGAYFEADTFPVYIESLQVHLRSPVNPSHSRYQLAVYLDDGTGKPGKLFYKTPVRYATPGVSAWNSVFVGGAGQQLVMPDGKFYVFYLQVGEPPECPYLEADGARSPIANYWKYRSGVMSPDSSPGDFMIRAVVNSTPVTPALVDMRTLYVDRPLYEFVQRPYNAAITPKTRVQNFGSQTVGPVTVELDIVGASWMYMDFVTINSLAPGQDTLLTFTNWTPSRVEPCSVWVTTWLAGDMVPGNNQKRISFDIVKAAHTGSSPLRYRWIDSDTIGGPTYAWFDTTGFTGLGELGDDNYAAIPFEPGMQFPYYDSTYDGVLVSSNGWVALGQTNPGGDLDTIANSIPTPIVPNRCVYAWWDNLAVGAGFGHGYIYYRWFGFSPNRYMVVTYLDATRVGADTSNGISFQLVFHEDGTIICQYKDVETGDLNFDNARNATIGIENPLGTDGLCYLYSVPPLSGGVNGLQNRLRPGLAIKFYPEKRDAAAVSIIRPASYEFPGPIIPQAKIRNVGTVYDSIRVFMTINGPTTYARDVLVPGLAPGDSFIVTFPIDTLVMGTYAAACSVHMVGDSNPANNLVTRTVYTTAWVRRADIPPQWKKRKVKSAALAYATTTDKIYAMKGSGSTDFWVYDRGTDVWDTLAPMPTAPSGKKPRDGVSFAFDPDHGTQGRIWAIKASGTPDFYYYDIANDSWVSKRSMVVTYRDLPYSNRTYRAPRRGSAIAYAAEAGTQGSVYGMPGNATNYFWRYDIAKDSWFYPHDSVYAERNGVPYYKYIPLDIPGGPFGIRCRYGSDMAYLSAYNRVYVLKGSGTVEAYGFSHLANAWNETLDMNTLYGYRNRRVKMGGALAGLGDRLYALKGGNTQQFWHYNFASDSWKQNTDLPVAASGRRVKVKRGARLAGADSTIFCLKGSSTYEFWEYGPGSDTVPVLAGPQPNREGVMAEVSGLDLSKPWLTAYPNPARLGLNISYNVTSTAPTRLRVYDAAGKVVARLWDATRSRGQYVTHWSGLAADGRQVPAGIYFAKLESGDTRLTQKLVIQR